MVEMKQHKLRANIERVLVEWRRVSVPALAI